MTHRRKPIPNTLWNELGQDVASLAHMIGHGVLFVFGIPCAVLFGAFLGYLILGLIAG